MYHDSLEVAWLDKVRVPSSSGRSVSQLPPISLQTFFFPPSSLQTSFPLCCSELSSSPLSRFELFFNSLPISCHVAFVVVHAVLLQCIYILSPQVDRRYAWLRRTLVTYKEECSSIFPSDWGIPERVAIEFCNSTRSVRTSNKHLTNEKRHVYYI